tara:strand:+ start:831 stop:983 length:153 start_codon:yes stop_codon:yes gene_type:complete
MTNNIIIFPKEKIIKEENNIINKEIIDKQYKQILKQQEEIRKQREEIWQT